MSSSKQHLDEANLCKFFYILAKKGYFDVKNAEKVVKKQRRTFGKNLDQTWAKLGRNGQV